MKNLTVSMTKPEKYFLAGYMLFELTLLPWLLQWLSVALNLGWSAAAVNFLFFLINFMVILFIAGRFFGHSLKAAVKMPKKLLSCWLTWFAVYWAATYFVSLAIILVYPNFANVNDASISVLTDTSPMLITLGAVLFVPLAEECLFRGLLFGSLHRHCRISAYAVSAAAFCLVHVIGYIGVYPLPLLALCLLQYVPAGLCLARAYEAADNIFAPILIHTTINAIGMIAMR